MASSLNIDLHKLTKFTNLALPVLTATAMSARSTGWNEVRFTESPRAPTRRLA